VCVRERERERERERQGERERERERERESVCVCVCVCLCCAVRLRCACVVRVYGNTCSCMYACVCMCGCSCVFVWVCVNLGYKQGRTNIRSVGARGTTAELTSNPPFRHRGHWPRSVGFNEEGEAPTTCSRDQTLVTEQKAALQNGQRDRASMSSRNKHFSQLIQYY